MSDDPHAQLRRLLQEAMRPQLEGVSRLICGLELAIAHVFNMLHHRAVMPLPEAIASLRATRESLPPDLPPEAALVLQGIERCLATLPAAAPSPAELRSQFRVIEGGRPPAPPTETDPSG